jgi:Zn-dependent protease
MEPARSPYDWQFSLFGFYVRVTWLFWLISAAWGYEWARGWDEVYLRLGLESPGPFSLLVVWVGVSFISILIHELGHSLMMRRFGISSYIVLYHFGGLAIPESFGSARTRFRSGHWEQIAISAAGPGLQLSFGLAVAGLAIASGCNVGTLGYLLGDFLPIPPGNFPSNALYMALIDSAIYTSVFWAILNLIPVLPMDGGRIAQELIAMNRFTDGRRETIILGIVVAIMVAIMGFQNERSTLAINFMILAILNYQMLNDPFSLR